MKSPSVMFPPQAFQSQHTVLSRMAITFSISEIIAYGLESIFFGAYVVLFLACLKVSWSKRKVSGLNYRMVGASVALFVLITWHEVMDTYRLVTAFSISETTGGADLYFADISSALGVLKTSIYLAITAVSDLLILYRCFIVWERRMYVVVLPLLLYVADIGVGIASVYTSSKGDAHAFSTEQERITNAFFSCTLALNALCTGLIAFRIAKSQRQTRATRGDSNLDQVTVIVVESGAIYVANLVIIVATFSSRSIVFNIFLDLLSPVIGIVFSLIIVRIGLGISSDLTTHQVSTIEFKSRRVPHGDPLSPSQTDYTSTGLGGNYTTHDSEACMQTDVVLSHSMMESQRTYKMEILGRGVIEDESV
ncbi:hypothetical protein OF83DRAFT_1142358 [Amylostereum chailletii]|nr:hypothetical protein OF83DRAFT_1142358 [Amylostereum chailletii]